MLSAYVHAMTATGGSALHHLAELFLKVLYLIAEAGSQLKLELLSCRMHLVAQLPYKISQVLCRKPGIDKLAACRRCLAAVQRGHPKMGVARLP